MSFIQPPPRHPTPDFEAFLAMTPRNELAVIADHLQSSQLRLMPVIGDSNSPVFEPGSFVVVAPAIKYSGSGYYIVHDGLGPVIMLCELQLPMKGQLGDVNCVFTNGRYSGWRGSLAKFEGVLLGKVAGHFKVLDPRLLPGGAL